MGIGYLRGGTAGVSGPLTQQAVDDQGNGLPVQLSGGTVTATGGGALAQGAAGATATPVETVGYSFNEITTAATTLVKTGASILHRVCINSPANSGTIKIYNAVTAAGTPITITMPTSAGNPVVLDYDAFFSTGITVVTSVAMDVTIIFR